nr:PREDICTED: cadherin-related family member 4-like isoform X2 [Lepisosteus oculatus]
MCLFLELNMRGTMNTVFTFSLSLILLMQVHESHSQTLSFTTETVSIPETSPPGTVVFVFTFSPASSIPTINCVGSSSCSSIFQLRATGTTATITLSSSAVLNHKITNQYTKDIYISYIASGTTFSAQARLYVVITPAPKCDKLFASAGGATVQVLQNLAPSSIIYIVNPADPNPGSYKYSMTPEKPFGININTGSVTSPEKGFSGPGSFKLSITVNGMNGTSCSGILHVKVLPVETANVTFPKSSYAVSIDENTGPGASVMTVLAKGSDIYYQIVPQTSGGYAAYQIHQRTGEIRTTYNLDLEANPHLNSTVFLVQAYDPIHKVSATATVSITVRDVNEFPPVCHPALIVAQIKESEPIGYKFPSDDPVKCVDMDRMDSSLTYSIVTNENSKDKFRISPQGGYLVLNSTLDYDSYEVANVNFLYTASIIVTDNGKPPLTTTIPVYITVTQVNEHPPVFSPCPQAMQVNENAPLGTVIGQVNATDRDWPFNNVEYSIAGGAGNNPPKFYIDPRSGEIHVLSHLDYEKQTIYQLKIKAVDMNQDISPDPQMQKTAFCTVTVRVQDENDNPPVCKPPYYEELIYSTLKTDVGITTIQCTDIDTPIEDLTYSIVRGNVNNRFTMKGSALCSRNAFSFKTPGVYDPTDYELLIEVKDKGPPVFSTTATVIVHVVPWTTTQPTTTVKTTHRPRPTKIVTLTVFEWVPDTWFVVVLTVAGALLLLALALLTWKLLTLTSVCGRAPIEATKPLLQDSGGQFRGVFDDAGPTSPSNLHQQSSTPPAADKEIPESPLSLRFDGRAQDPITGREYIFNSVTGQRRWL